MAIENVLLDFKTYLLSINNERWFCKYLQLMFNIYDYKSKWYSDYTTLKNKIIIITIFYLFTKPLNKMATKIQKVLK